MINGKEYGIKITQSYVTLTPAYRDYKSAKECKAAFEEGKDFYLEPAHILCSVRDFETGVTVNLRYKQLRNVTPYTVK